ncbi:hypothetical protein ADIS_0453 [Lunatimonas lonarensis]|uniref:DUF6850 domain-containing protein n=1 Tax=Lunatimonas lonarensis TaxID=1232681 RepID=R7ZY07_9BACT|nr:DUF6850 family outer membrane beta-barrel protein [Lunatimonas lonarensis]EON79036.1 hypothetical protein ADIS_0453 [Lunatimonas lonarensis]
MKRVKGLLRWLVFSLFFTTTSLTAFTLDSLSLKNEQMGDFHPIQYFLRQDISWHAAYPFLMQETQTEFYRAVLSYAKGGGMLVESLKPEAVKTIGFYSQSRKQLGSWSLQGDFHYTRQVEIVRPFLLQRLGNQTNPFLLGQEQTSPWSGDLVAINLSGNAARYKQGKLGNFFLVNYQVETSSMDAEPRPLYHRNEYQIQVGQNFRPNVQTEIGLAGRILKGNEENQLGVFAAQEFSLVFMRGLNTFSRNAFQSFTRNQFTEELALQFYGKYTFSNSSMVFVALKNGSRSATIRDGIAFPLDGGSLRGNTYSIHSGLIIPFKAHDYQQHLSWEGSNGTALDPVFQAINYHFGTRTWQGVHTLSGKQANQVAELYWSFKQQSDEDLAAGTQRRFSSLYFLASNALSVLNYQNASLFIRPGIGMFLPQSNSFPEGQLGIAQFVHHPNRLFYGGNHFEGQLACWLLLRSEKESIKLGADYSYRTQRSRSFSFLQVNLSLIL